MCFITLSLFLQTLPAQQGGGGLSLIIMMAVIVIMIVAIVLAISGFIRNRRNWFGSTADEIEKLARLRNQGLLTDEEFEEQKKKLLKRG